MRQCFRSLLLMTVLVLPLPSAVRAQQGAVDGEPRLGGALAFVESLAMRRIVEAIRVDAPAEATLGLQPGAGPGVWTISGTATVVDFAGRSANYPYRVALVSRCEAYDQSRCWDLRSFSIGQWTLSDDTPTVAGLASLGDGVRPAQPASGAGREPEAEAASDAGRERKAETATVADSSDEPLDEPDSRYLSPDPSKVFEEIRLARRVRDDGRGDAAPLPVLPEVPLPPAPYPGQEAAAVSKTSTFATTNSATTSSAATVASPEAEADIYARGDQSGQSGLADAGGDLAEPARTPTPEELARAIKTYRTSQGGAGTGVPEFGAIERSQPAAGAYEAEFSAGPSPKAMALVAMAQADEPIIAELAAQEPESVERLLDKSRRGDARAQFELAERYRLGRGVAQDYGKAVALYRQSADQGEADAQYQLGLMYGEGESVTQSHARAVELFRAAAVQGHAEAQHALAQSYDKGQGVAADAAIAVEWYRLSAQQGNAWAQLALGNHYRIGKGIARDLTRSIGWYRKAAKQGNSWAQFELGNSYRYGKGIRRDATLAQGWLQLSADAGNSGAQFALASMLSKGEAVEGARVPIETLMADEPEAPEPALQAAVPGERGETTLAALTTGETQAPQAAAESPAERPAMSQLPPPLPPKPAPRPQPSGWDESEPELAIVAPTPLPEVVTPRGGDLSEVAAAAAEPASMEVSGQVSEAVSQQVSEPPAPRREPEKAVAAPEPPAVTLMQAIATPEESVGQAAPQEIAYVPEPETVAPRGGALAAGAAPVEPGALAGRSGGETIVEAAPAEAAATTTTETLPPETARAEPAPAETARTGAAEAATGRIAPVRLGQRGSATAGDFPKLDESLAFLTGAMDVAADPIALLLERADRQMANLALTTPRGASAYDTYQEILTIQPDHPEALEGIRQIGVKYAVLAERALDRGAWKKAEVYVAKAQKLAPGHPKVAALETAWAALEGEKREVTSPTSLLRNTKMLPTATGLATGAATGATASGREAAPTRGLIAETEPAAGSTGRAAGTPEQPSAESAAPAGSGITLSETPDDPGTEVIMRGLFYAQAGLEAQQNGDLKQAIEFYRLAIEARDLSDKSLAYIYNNVGASYRTMGSYELAVESYDAAIRLRPRYATAFFNRGIAYDQQGLDIQAFEDFDTAIRLRPDLSGAYNYRGLAYVKAGRYDLAIQDFSEAIRLDPDLDAAYFNRAQAYHLKGDRERAVQDIEKSYSMSPDNLDYLGKMKEFGLL